MRSYGRPRRSSSRQDGARKPPGKRLTLPIVKAGRVNRDRHGCDDCAKAKDAWPIGGHRYADANPVPPRRPDGRNRSRADAPLVRTRAHRGRWGQRYPFAAQCDPCRSGCRGQLRNGAAGRAGGGAPAGKSVCVAGGRHAMGGQQFAAGAVLLDMRPMNRIVSLDRSRGIVEAEAGIQWPELIHGLIAMQKVRGAAWGIVQKQTGADRLTLGGALAGNIHGRGLTLRPIIGDVESFTLMDADGRLRTCSRSENAELFPPRDRRLRPVRRGHPRAAASDAAHQARARGAAHRHRRADAGVRAAHRRRIPLRRLPVLDRHAVGHLSAQGRVLVLSPAAARHPDAGGAEGAGRGALARALSPVACRHAARLRGLHLLLSVHDWAALLVRYQPAQRLHRRLSRRARPAARCRAQGLRDDHRALRPAPGAAGVSRRRRADFRRTARS